MKVDNFTLEQFQCPAKYDLRIRRQLLPLRRKISLSFGTVIHHGFAAWYRTGSELEALKAVANHWPEVGISDDFRNLGYACQVIRAYIREHPTESFTVIQGPEGPVVEQAFTVDTGLMLDEEFREGDPDQGHILYGGIIDLGVDFNGVLYVLDHKTTTVLGDGDWYFAKFKPDNQMTGYIWGLSRISSQRVGGALINAVGLYKSGDIRFKRQITSRNQFEIDEWLDGVRTRCNEIKRCERNKNWRLETSCCTLYGKCEYYDVHVLNDPDDREKWLAQNFVKSEWNYEDRDD